MIGLARGTARLASHDRRWAIAFHRERDRLQRVLGRSAVAIEHIGSTAVPGLAAKPIIDILVGVQSLRCRAAALRRSFGALGYEYRANGSTAGEHLVFAKGPEEHRTHYVHVVEYRRRRWQRDLRFRDVLRSDSTLRAAYATLKQALAREYQNNRRMYTAQKASFIRRALQRHPHTTARDMDIERAVAHLRTGGLLIYPTETAYALGCDATNARAVRAIFRLKGRERGKPLPLIVASRAMVDRYAHFTPLARQLAQRHWPGALTMVLNVAEAFRPPHGGATRGDLKVAATFPPGVLAPDGSVALRISSHLIARALSRALGRPIISTSANRSGQPPCYTIQSALRSLDYQKCFQNEVTYLACGRTRNMSRPAAGGETPEVGRVSSPGVEEERSDGKTHGVRRTTPGGIEWLTLCVLDTGPLQRRRPSTTVDARGGHPIVLRHGAIRVEMRSATPWGG